MGKRPPKNANPGGGKKKKRSRVQRDYDDGDDVMVDSAPPKGRGPRETQGRMEALRTRWTRVREASYLQAQAKRFEKPKPAPKPKGKTQTQRRTERRRAALGEAPARSWPTKREVRAQAAGGVAFEDAAAELGIGARGEDDDGEVPEEASGSEEEEDGEEEAEVDEDAEEEEGIEVEEEEEEDEDEEEEEEEDFDDDDGGDGDDAARDRAAMDRQFGAALGAAEVAALGARRAGRDYAAVGAGSGAAKNCLGAYRDVLAARVAPSATRRREPLLRATLAHAVDHVLRSQARQRRHDRRVADADAAPVEARKGVARSAPLEAPEPTERFKTLLDDGADGGGDGGAPRDQGLTRARVLVLVPTRKAALEVCETPRALRRATSRLGRLRRECGPGDDDDEGGATKREGPPDWEAVFGGNCDDDAAGVGRALVPGSGARKFFADYERNGADVVVATPLNNWDHVERALGACNGPPSAVDADVSRVREPYLDGHGAACRQLVALSLSRSRDARLRSLVDAPGPGSLRNRAGAVRLAAPPTADGASGWAWQRARGRARALPVAARVAPARAADAKVRYFRDDVLSPQFVQSLRDDSRDDRTLVYCASYRSSSRARRARAKGAPFLAIHEYSRGSEVRNEEEGIGLYWKIYREGDDTDDEFDDDEMPYDVGAGGPDAMATEYHGRYPVLSDTEDDTDLDY
ncbi:U3 snoRNA binding protein [Aureococcus anophagefferens]|uniref:U3 snoRNA binding protein n=1 Tax=Aureococcus anophagefferens TaxID=44056 RepID=A0ABR1G7F6_AURAN